MKKSASILLLLVFLFNTIGYRVLFFYLEKQADARIEAKIRMIDEDDDRLVAVKLPINLPYQTDWREFESVDGEMTYQGTTYKYVKRKVMRDTLILLCIDHKEKSHLEQKSSEFFSKVNDLTSESSKIPVLKIALPDYYQVLGELFQPLRNPLSLIHYHHSYTPLVASGYPHKVKMPPRKHTVSC